LPGGEYTIGREDARLVGRLLHSTIDVHPVFSCVASLRSLGISIDALCRLCEFELAAGPLLGEFGVRFRSPLQAGVCYQVTGLIESIDRTQSARLGVLDRLRFSVELTEPSGESALEANYLWLLPRGPVPA
jgi:hypothetical protein